jgi:ParB family chromosome partitioning protein
VKISEIEVTETRKRGLCEKTVLALMESIKSVGLLNPITISRGSVLVSGLHRLEACKRLGIDDIAVRILDLDELQQELAEIDENLVRNELTALERSEHLARRKDIYEALNPSAIGPGRRGASKAKSFTASAAEITGANQNTINEEVRIGSRIAEDVREAIKSTPLASIKSDLVALARMDPDEQREAIKPVLAGKTNTVRDPVKVDLVGQVLRIIARMTPEQRAELAMSLKSSGVLK